MNPRIFVLAVAVALFAHPVLALTNEDTAALKQLTKEYASWDYSGRPVEFRERLDYPSYEEQRRILLKLAEVQWSGFWGDYWRRRGLSDLKSLRALSAKDFWLRYHSVLEPRPTRGCKHRTNLGGRSRHHRGPRPSLRGLSIHPPETRHGQRGQLPSPACAVVGWGMAHGRVSAHHRGPPPATRSCPSEETAGRVNNAGQELERSTNVIC